jgi:hypothetical protein
MGKKKKTALYENKKLQNSKYERPKKRKKNLDINLATTRGDS